MWAAALVGSLAVLVAVSDARPARGPFLLVSVAALGTVTWTCSTQRRAYALGYRAFARSATTTVELRSGGRLLARRVVHPGRSVRFGFLPRRTQRLSLVQGTGAGTLRASVAVDFVPNTPTTYCESYAPPAATVSISPRG